MAVYVDCKRIRDERRRKCVIPVSLCRSVKGVNPPKIIEWREHTGKDGKQATSPLFLDSSSFVECKVCIWCESLPSVAADDILVVFLKVLQVLPRYRMRDIFWTWIFRCGTSGLMSSFPECGSTHVNVCQRARSHASILWGKLFEF